MLASVVIVRRQPALPGAQCVEGRYPLPSLPRYSSLRLTANTSPFPSIICALFSQMDRPKSPASVFFSRACALFEKQRGCEGLSLGTQALSQRSDLTSPANDVPVESTTYSLFCERDFVKTFCFNDLQPLFYPEPPRVQTTGDGGTPRFQSPRSTV